MILWQKAKKNRLALHKSWKGYYCGFGGHDQLDIGLHDIKHFTKLLTFQQAILREINPPVSYH